ncbi:MAG: DUF4838 domain-containing protein [Lentisphaeria bacterium]|jgi:hypothetical protein|nr:DUF4838 domain-containing protein [Lentisphaeria bacterium]
MKEETIMMKKHILFGCLIIWVVFSSFSLDAQAANPELWVNDKHITSAKVEVMVDRKNLNRKFQKWLDTSVADLEKILPEFGIRQSEEARFSIVVGEVVPEALNALAQRERYPRQTSVISTGDDTVYITSPGARGLSKAVYTFLDRLGVRWYTPGKWGVSLPEGKVELAKGSFVDGPDFLFRSFYWGKIGGYPKDMQEDYERWYLRMRMDSDFGFGGHSYSEQIAPPGKYAAEHPEYYSLIGGRRIAAPQTAKSYSHQLCVSNKDVQRLAADFARNHFAESETYRVVSISPNDGANFCECGRCREIGGPIEHTVFLANVVGRAVREEYPDRWVGFYAYSSHILPPENMQLESNVVPYIVNSHRALGQNEWKYMSAPVRSTAVGTVIVDWARLGGKTAMRFNWGQGERDGWEYPYNWVSHLQDDFRLFRENKAIGVMAESESSFIHQGWLNYWAARLGWDIEIDIDDEYAKLYQRFYGPGAHVAKQVLESIQNRQERQPPLSAERLQEHEALLKTTIAEVEDKLFHERLVHLLHYSQFLLARARYYNEQDSTAAIHRSLKQIEQDRSHALNLWQYSFLFPKVVLNKFGRVHEGTIRSWRDPVVYQGKQTFAVKVLPGEEAIRFHLQHVKVGKYGNPLELKVVSPKGYLIHYEEVPADTKLDKVIPVTLKGTYLVIVDRAGFFRVEAENTFFSIKANWFRPVLEADKTITRYFYVPRGLESFATQVAAGTGGDWTMRLIDPSGGVALSKDDLLGTVKFNINVPEKARGKIWKLEVSGEISTRIRVLPPSTMPWWFASEPSRLIVPQQFLQ